ncbi:MAG: CusA/CzcA family heavy metal efflux RND transporter [Campylobacteraceae bacterium 4484_4]|nr:MAG: CusA/CzcA family heavy metal efflux RND transporter [Campylobacteraceae bacterium 4484_4]
MDSFFHFLLRYRFLILSLFIAIAGFGYKAYTEIPVDAFPDITPKQVVIYTESPGNSAQDIEKLITYPIESAMAGLPGVKLLLSNSMFGLSYVSIFFEDRYDIYFLRQLVSERLSGVEIPKGWGKPVMGPNTTGLGQVFWYQLEDTTGTHTLTELRELQTYIVSPMLKSVDGVEEVTGWGGFEKQYEVLIDPKKLQALQVTYDDIITALERSNQSAGGQYLEFNREQYMIRGAGFYRSIEDIKNSVVRTTAAKAVTIGDVAEIRAGKAPRFGAVTIDGEEAMFAMVLQRSGTNAAEVVAAIKAKLPLITAALPKGVRIRPIYDRTEITRKAVSTMSGALLGGALLVAIVLFLFLFELRSALIVILSLPLSLLIAFLLMRHFGISANLMSLSGLAIAIGMIVDGTIVVVENSFRLLHDRSDLSKAEVIAKATSGVAKPVLFALLIIAAIFIPLLSLGGLAGKLYTPMAIDIVFVMFGSLAVALLLVPILSYMLLRPTARHESFLIRGIKKLYTPLLSFSLRHARLLSILSITIFLLSTWLLSRQGRAFMPELNEASIMYRVIAIPGTALSQSIETSEEIERYLLSRYPREVSSVLSMIGRSEKGETAQANYMEILLTLKKEVKDIASLAERMTRTLQKEFGHVQFVPTQPIAMRIEELLEGVKAELAVKIYGEDQKVMAKIAAQITRILSGIEGLEHSEVERQLGQAQITIRPDYLALARYGIGVDEVMRLIRHGIGEEAVTEKIEGVRRFGIVPKIKNAKKDIETLKATEMRSQSGKLVRLDEICRIETLQGPSFIKREDLSRYMVISMELKGRDVASFVDEAQRKIEQEIRMPEGYYTRWAGEFKNMKDATRTLKIIIPVTLLLVILLLYTAFNSLKKSLLILSGVPLGLIGGIFALVISGEYLSVSAIIGFIVIFAIAILNGIVLVSFIDELRMKFGHVKMEILIRDATLLRLRPVLMTAFTTLFGILPLLFASGVGSEIQYPLAVVVTGGIISSTLLTLLVLPALYLLFYREKPRPDPSAA